MKMYLVLLLSIYIMQSCAFSKLRCNGRVFLNQYYEVEKISGSYNQPMNLAVHSKTDELFFSYSYWMSGLRIGVCDIKKRTCHDVKGVQNGRAVAHDPLNKEIYFGGKGIYKYNTTTKTADLYSKFSGVHHIFIGRKFYVIRGKQLFVQANNAFINAIDTAKIEIDKFLISGRLAIYYTNNTGLYKADTPRDKVYLLSNTVKVTQITEDLTKGIVFFVANDGIYVDDYVNRKLLNIFHIKDLMGIAFRKMGPEYESTQLIYSDYYSIYILMPSNQSELCFKKKMKKYNSFNPNNDVQDYLQTD